MESRLGVDLSNVRVHTDGAAAASANALSARAFTHGEHIAFAEGAYRPETTEGRRLLAHELTHVAQQRGGRPVVQRKEAPKEEAQGTVGTAAPIVEVKAVQGQTGAAWGYDANGGMTLIEILANTLGPGAYTISPTVPPHGSTDPDYVQYVGPGFSWRQPAANFRPGEKVTVTIAAKTADRFAALPEYIRNHLLARVATGSSALDLERLADEGERLVSEGITAADLALAANAGSAIEVEGAAPREDLVDSLRRRGFSDFPSREEYDRRLAWQTAHSSDYRRWWTNDDLAAWWKEFPEEARDDWNKFVNDLYTSDKQDEEAKWLEAFRRIDSAAGIANVIAVVTVIFAGGFVGAEAAAVLPEIPALPATIQGVPTAVWAKTLAAAGFGASYLSHVVSRSTEGAEHGETNPFVIAATAFDDAMGAGKVYESIGNQSLLTGEDLHLSTSERVVGGLVGGLETLMNFWGAKDFIGEPVPTVKVPEKPTPPVEPQAPPPAQGASGVAPWTADELAAMQEQGITNIGEFKAAREAGKLKVAEQQQAVEIVQAEAQPKVAQMSGGGGGSRVTPVRSSGSGTTSTVTSSGAGGTSTRIGPFKRVGPSTGQRTPYDLEAAAGGQADEADDLLESMNALKGRDPAAEGKLIEGEFDPANVRRTPAVRVTEYDPAVGDSALLGKRLRAEGRLPSGPGAQAHHMVPSNEPMADQVRNFIRERGFKDINDPDNGVWLPTGKQTTNIRGEFKHEFTFDNASFGGEYFHRLEDIFMVEGITETGIRLRMRMLRESLLKGELPPAEAFANLPL
ncbi:hypothetical protein GCM10028796_57430 [Ramlibacter monticola]